MIAVIHGDGLAGSSFNYVFNDIDEINLSTVVADETRQVRSAMLLLPGLDTIGIPNALAPCEPKCIRRAGAHVMTNTGCRYKFIVNTASTLLADRVTE